MLARLALLFVILPTLALAASDKVMPGAGKLTVPPPVKPDPVESAATAPARATSPPVLAYAPPAAKAADPSGCRMDCAQTMYFCRAEDQPDACSSAWTRCVSTCNSPELDHADSAAP